VINVPKRIPELLCGLFLLVCFSGCSRQESRQIGLEVRIDSVLNAAYESHAFEGVVRISDGKGNTVERALGLADRDAGTANSADTRFRMASVTKSFTAYLTLLLVESGELDLDESIVTYLPEWKGNPSITLHHLLSNTSGLPHYEGLRDVGMSPETFRPLAMDGPAFVDLVGRMQSACDPGACFHYSSFGYDMVGAVIEAVTNNAYGNVLRERLLGPLGLENTGYATASDSVPGLAYGYEPTSDDSAHVFMPAIFRDPANAFSAGGLFTTVADLARWSSALQGIGPLSADLLLRMKTDQVGPPDENVRYGYGLSIHDGQAGNEFGDIGLDESYVIHGGAFDGFRSLFVSAENGATIIILSNVGAATDELGLGRALASVLNASPQG